MEIFQFCMAFLAKHQQIIQLIAEAVVMVNDEVFCLATHLASSFSSIQGKTSVSSVSLFVNIVNLAVWQLDHLTG